MAEKEWNPGPKYRMYLDKIQSILGDEERTVRDIYYALEARGFPKELAAHGYEFEYRYVKRAVKKGRRHGYISPANIVDTSRSAATTQRDSHSSPKSFTKHHERQLNHGYFENFWDDQPSYVEVWLEKASLSSVFEPICNRHNVRLEATRGDWSDSKVYEACQRLGSRVRDGKHVRVLYFGDYNPSGLHAPVSVQETMAFYGIDLPREYSDSIQPGYFDIWPFGGPVQFTDTDGGEIGTMAFDRISLTLDEIERFSLPENPTPSSTDKDRTLRDRFKQFASDGRDVNIELNALKEYHREYLEDRLEDAITEHIDEDARERTQARRDSRQETIRTAVDIDYSVFEDGGE